MDAIQVLAPLLGVILGGVLSGFTAFFRARQERKRIIATALADLLEVRHRVVGFNLVMDKIQSLAGIPQEVMPTLRNLLDSITPLDTGLDERYNHAVTLLAGIDPVLGFSLRSKQTLPKVLSALRAHAAASNTDLAFYETVEAGLLTAVKPTLDSAVMELARNHSFFTTRKVAQIVGSSTEMQPEMSQFFERVIPSSSTSTPSGSPSAS